MFQAVKQLGSKAVMLASVLAISAAAAPAMAADKPMAVQIFNAGHAPSVVHNKLFDAGRKQVSCGVQFTGTIPAQTTYLYYTFDWNPAEYIEWSVMSDSVYGSSEFTLSNVATQRSDASDVTYWLTITNNTTASQNFEGRYCIL